MKQPFKKSSVISENHLFEFELITFLPYRDEANPDLDFELDYIKPSLQREKRDSIEKLAAPWFFFLFFF